MAQSRSMYEIKQDAERSRAELAGTVDALRASISGVKQRMEPDSLKAEAAHYAQERGRQIVDAARQNPAQAAAVVALAGWPLYRLARAIPLPIAMIGAGLFLTGTRTGKRVVDTAADRAADLADEVNRRTHDLRENAGDAVEAATGAISSAADRLTTVAAAAAGSAVATAGDAAAAARGAVADAAKNASETAQILSAAGTQAKFDIGQTTAQALGAAGEAAQAAAKHAQEAVRAGAGAVRDKADPIVAFAKENPLIVGGLGLVIGGFLASAIPATAAERGVAGLVGAGVRTGLKSAALKGAAQAAGAAVQAATSGFQQQRQTAAMRECERDLLEEARDDARAADYGTTGG
ncbi:MAG: hypothetical protein KGM42_04595 [Hyphomicrobiales bacterium]|nr:hypothetical protein [Hyphomicrobiales bacterium]